RSASPRSLPSFPTRRSSDLLIGCYLLLPTESPGAGDLILRWHVPLVDWLIPLNLTGLERAALMCLQILTLLLASMVVRVTGSGRSEEHTSELQSPDHLVCRL